jgi:hypothetical protein
MITSSRFEVPSADHPSRSPHPALARAPARLQYLEVPAVVLITKWRPNRCHIWSFGSHATRHSWSRLCFAVQSVQGSVFRAPRPLFPPSSPWNYVTPPVKTDIVPSSSLAALQAC